MTIVAVVAAAALGEPDPLMQGLDALLEIAPLGAAEPVGYLSVRRGGCARGLAAIRPAI